jgi:hypothetical protein
MPPGRLVALLVLVFLGAATGTAQSYAGLSGRILDTSEAGIPGAVITAVNEDSGFRRTVESELTGAYAIPLLEAGAYKITARKPGFRTVIRFGVRVETGGATRAEFILPVGSIEESITVTGSAPVIAQEQDAAAGSRFERQDMEHLPLNGRGLLTLLELVPGTNVVPATRGEAGQFTVSGQRPNTNYFTVDGVSANTGVSAGGLPAQSTGGVLPGLSAFGSLDSVIATDAIEEFRVQTSTSAAEFGRLPGASVAITSRSGTARFHGSANYRVRNELFGANDWFGNQFGYGRAPLRLEDASATLGGPVRRDRTFFFLSFEHMAMRQPYVWVQPVPSADVRQSAASWAAGALNLFPLPNAGTLAGGIGEWVGRNDRPAGLDAGSARVDHALTSRLTLFGRYSDSPSHNEFGSIQVNRLDLRLRSLTLGLNARPSERTVLDVRANVSQADAHSVWTDGSETPGCDLQPMASDFLGTPVSCDYMVRFSIGGVGQLVSGREGDRRQRQEQVLESTSLARGPHTVKFGADYRRILAVRHDETGTLGIIADSMTNLVSSSAVWVAKSDAIRRSIPVNELSLWAQDSWQPVPRLTVNAGLRWEFSPAPLPDAPAFFFDPLTESVVSQHRKLWPTSYRNFAPRLGMAYRLTGDGRTVLRAGGGLYYNSSLSIATDTINSGPLGISEFGGTVVGIFPSVLGFGFEPDLSLPQVAQWNVSLERAWGNHDVVSVSYLGSSGRSLIRREVGGAGNSNTTWVALTTNEGQSDYDALQVEYRRSLAAGFEARASYAWSHSIDNDSSDASLVWAGPGVQDRGSSDFDLRHSLTAGLTYGYTAGKGARALARVASGWALDAVLRARSGFPMTVLASDEFVGITLMNAFRPNLVAGQPLWIADPAAPAHRRLNPAAFALAPYKQQGNLGRNVLTGFGMCQLDLALRREFRVGEQKRFQIRLEGFNALNQTNFADPVRYLNSPVFGESTSMLNMMLGTGTPGSGLAPILQTGGPRTLQGSLRFQF